MDEIGRGTSTRDGLAIARAVCVYILDHVGARTLFATHFHELTELAHPALENLSMDVRDEDGEIVFLKRVKQGPSSNSYGIHVARLAGIPAEVLAKAEQLVQESALPAAAAQPEKAQKPSAAVYHAPSQGELFSTEELIIREIRGYPLDSTTPLEAINRIARWKKQLDSGRRK